MKSSGFFGQRPAARRNLLRWQQTRKDAIFLRVVTLDRVCREFLANENGFVFIDSVSDEKRRAP